MLAKILSSAVIGVGAYVVKVEVDVSSGGMPTFNTVGLPDSAIKESKERVTSAIRNSDYYFPSTRVTVNLAPANIRKEGSAFDLPIALGLLSATGQVKNSHFDQFAIFGELALDGTVRPIRGSLPMAICARDSKLKGIILPEENAREAAVVNEIEIYPVKSLSDAANFLNGENQPKPFAYDLGKTFNDRASYAIDFSDVKGQEHAKRAAEVAAAGGHNLLMVGPPGSGKTMIAKRIPTILPTMAFEEALETTKVHSVAGFVNDKNPIITTRPYRSPHHSISDAGLVGGGRIPRPGEVSLSHNGLLFLDELAEFRKNVLEMMRQPLEDREVTIARASATITYPANFMLVAAMNPCPCGFHGDRSRECRCEPKQIQRYISRISGPLLDRFDMQVEVPAVKYKDLSNETLGEKSEAVRVRVQEARSVQQERFIDTEIFCNADMESQQLREFCRVSDAAQKLLEKAITKLGLSARAYDRILKVSRTIADLEKSEGLEANHLSEAIQYRSLDRSR